MSLFEHHKLLFAFFLSLKIFETNSDSSDESFADKLKQLDKLGDESASKQDTSSKQSDEQSKSKTLTGLKPGWNKNQATFSRRSGSVRGNDEVKVLEKEDVRLKINEDLLNYTLTGLLPRGMEMYSADPNPKPSLFTD